VSQRPMRVLGVKMFEFKRPDAHRAWLALGVLASTCATDPSLLPSGIPINAPEMRVAVESECALSDRRPGMFVCMAK
jgi:hypothetical protein